MRWLIIDRLYNAEAFTFGHLDSYGFYIEAMGEQVDRLDVSGQMAFERTCDEYDVVFALEGYELALKIPASVRIAQVACGIEVPRGFSMIISSIPAMVEKYAARGDVSCYQALCFDLRARACMMGVKREKKCIFIGSLGPAHTRRAELIKEAGDLVEALPPVFGRAYFRALAGATAVFNPHAGWCYGAVNNMRTFESAGLGATPVNNQLMIPDGFGPKFGSCFSEGDDRYGDMRRSIERATSGDYNQEDEATVLAHHTYERRIPDLIRWAKEA
jgi:hypothetical protein